MPNEAPSPRGWRSPRGASAVWVMVIVVVFGGGFGGALVAAMTQHANVAARHDMQAFGESVARTVATQFARAGSLDIALDEVPGAEAYLRKVQQETPGVARIAVFRPDGTLLHGVGPSPQGEPTDPRAAIAVQDRTLGEVRVGLASTAKARAVRGLLWMFPAGVALIAAIAGFWVWWRPGASLQQRHDWLDRGLRGDDAALAALTPWASTHESHDALDKALHALSDLERDLRERRAEFDGLAEELLAVDFDDRQAPAIEALRQQVARACAGPEGA